MRNISNLALSFLPLLIASNAFAQCPAGSPCAVRNSGNTYNSQYERPYGAPDYSQNEQEYDVQVDQNSSSMTNRPVPQANPNMNPDIKPQRNPNMNPNMNPGVTNNPGAVTPPPKAN